MDGVLLFTIVVDPDRDTRHLELAGQLGQVGLELGLVDTDTGW